MFSFTSFTTSMIFQQRINTTYSFTSPQTSTSKIFLLFTVPRNTRSFWFYMCLSLRQITFWHYTNLSLCRFISSSVPTSQSCRRLAGWTSSPLVTPTPFKLSRHQSSQAANAWVQHFSARATPYWGPTLSMTAWAPSSLLVLRWSRHTASSGSRRQEKRFLALVTIPGWCTQ